MSLSMPYVQPTYPIYPYIITTTNVCSFGKINLPRTTIGQLKLVTGVQVTKDCQSSFLSKGIEI